MECFGWRSGGPNRGTGVVFRCSEIQFAHIRDGTSNTYLLGERHLDPLHYFTTGPSDDDQGWDLGYDFDTNRWTYHRPWRDTPGYLGREQFGSAHPSGFHMAMCDGSVHRIGYSIDLDIHRALGHRASGTVIPGDALR